MMIMLLLLMMMIITTPVRCIYTVGRPGVCISFVMVAMVGYMTLIVLQVPKNRPRRGRIDLCLWQFRPIDSALEIHWMCILFLIIICIVVMMGEGG